MLVADYLSDGPGHRLASFSSNVSTFDAPGATTLAREYGIRGVITTGTDQPLVTMADVADALGLPCYLTPEQARRCTDKIRMLAAFCDKGLPVPAYRILQPDQPLDSQVAALKFPLVIKPVDSQGQRGVSVVTDHSQLADAAKSALVASIGGQAIAQEFITGPEITITGWVTDGRFMLGSVTDRHTYNRDPATGVCFQHVYPSRQSADHLETFRELAVAISEVFEIRHGPIYIQCIVNENSVWLVEATCRLGGGHEGKLVEFATGSHFDACLLDLCLTGASGGMLQLPDFPVPGCYNLITFLLAQPGRFEVIEIADSARGVVQGESYYGRGYCQNPIVDGQGRVGFLHCQGNSREDMLDNAFAAYKNCQILDQDGNNLLFWPATEDLNL